MNFEFINVTLDRYKTNQSLSYLDFYSSIQLDLHLKSY